MLLLLVGVGFGPYLGRLFSYLVAATVTWWFNRHHTFHAETSPGGLPREWLRYLLANAVGGGVNYLVYAVAVVQVPIVREYLIVGVALGSIAGLAINFLANKHWVFGRR